MDDDDYDAYNYDEYSAQESVYSNQSNEFRDEWNWMDRAGGVIDENVNMFGHEDIKFAGFVKSVAKDLSEYTVVDVTSDINFIEHQIGRIHNAKFKNPTGYILGYWVTTNEGINKKRFDIVKKPSFLKKLRYPLKDYDIIRYANLWVKQNLKYN
jgi:hypothetical protein